jgi:hypothetical protein
MLHVVKNIANERFFWCDIFIIVGGKNRIFFLFTYLIGQISESERPGNKENFDVGLVWI